MGAAGAAFTLVVDVLVDKSSYFPAFVAAALIPFLGTLSILILIRDPKRGSAAMSSTVPVGA